MWLLLVAAISSVLSLVWAISLHTEFDADSSTFVTVITAAAGLNLYILLILWRATGVATGFSAVVQALETRFCDSSLEWHAERMRIGWECIQQQQHRDASEVDKDAIEWVKECGRLGEFYPLFARLHRIVSKSLPLNPHDIADVHHLLPLPISSPDSLQRSPLLGLLLQYWSAKGNFLGIKVYGRFNINRSKMRTLAALMISNTLAYIFRHFY